MVAPGSEGSFRSLNEVLIARAAQRGNASARAAQRSIANRLIQGEGGPCREAHPRPAPCRTRLSTRSCGSPDQGEMSLLIAHTTVILVHACRLAGFQVGDAETDSPAAIIQRFLQAVELHFREDWPVSCYASQAPGLDHRSGCARPTRAGGFANGREARPRTQS
jgi:AraC family transcriptional regulator, transcriptional activator of pobA